MEFNFDISKYFRNEITRLESRLIPEGFSGDRREIQECITRMSLVLTVLGESSAKAQGLQRVITSGERLRNSDHVVYILTDSMGGSRGSGSVLGMLKMGVKHLYVFDASGNHHETSANCVLDFYVHESMQRMGLGKKLFEYMLNYEEILPQHLAIDKPSPKFLSFLHKHYGLETIIPQMNNFVVFDGFFNDRKADGRKDSRGRVIPAGVTSSATRISAGYGSIPQQQQTAAPQLQQQVLQSPNNYSINNSVRYGRSAACKPVSTMGMILQNKPLSSPQPAPTGRPSEEQVKEEENDKENEGDPETLKNGDADVQEEEINGIQEDEEVVEDQKEVINEPEVVVQEVKESEGRRESSHAGNPPHLDLKFYHSSLW